MGCRWDRSNGFLRCYPATANTKRGTISALWQSTWKVVKTTDSMSSLLLSMKELRLSNHANQTQSSQKFISQTPNSHLSRCKSSATSPSESREIHVETRLAIPRIIISQIKWIRSRSYAHWCCCIVPASMWHCLSRVNATVIDGQVSERHPSLHLSTHWWVLPL